MSRKEARATPLDRPPPLRPRVGCALHRNLNPLPQEDLRCCMVRVNTTSSCKSCRIQGQTRSYRPATAPTHLLQQSSRHEHQRSIHVLGAGMVINVNVQAQLKPDQPPGKTKTAYHHASSNNTKSQDLFGYRIYVLFRLSSARIIKPHSYSTQPLHQGLRPMRSSCLQGSSFKFLSTCRKVLPEVGPQLARKWRAAKGEETKYRQTTSQHAGGSSQDGQKRAA